MERTVVFYIMWYGRRDVLGAMLPRAKVSDITAELRKYAEQWVCFTVRVAWSDQV